MCAWEGDMQTEVTLASNPDTSRKDKDIGRAWGKMKRREIKKIMRKEMKISG